MFPSKFALLSLVGYLLVGVNAFAQHAHTPAPGSAERKAIMDALRAPAEKDLGQKVIFKVDALKVVGNWAFARVSPTRPDGGEINYSRTRYREDVASGAFDPQGEGLVKRTADGWATVEWRFGATDTEVEIWAKKYGLSLSLFR